MLSAPLVAVTSAAQDHILLYDISTGARREFTVGAGSVQVWSFSADGCRMIFTMSDGIAPGKLYSVRLDGSDVRDLVQYDELPWGAWDVSISPADGRIAFRMERTLPDGTRDYRIAWIPPEGGAPEFYSISGDEHSAQWSPDGSWLAYIAFDERVAGARIDATAEPTPIPPPGQPTQTPVLLREADLWMVSADGKTKYRLTFFDTGSVTMPRWSPDGELIGFVYSPSPGSDTLWMIAAKAGSIPTQLSYTPSLVLDVNWLPDSTALLTAARDFQGVSENRLWRIPLVGNADTDATQYSTDPALSHMDYPRFSPDGRWLALRSAYALALVNTADLSWSLPDEAALGNTPPVWSPAGFAGEATCS